ncbi:MAG TPA: hypothetical protein VJ546_04115, partial [Bacillales bacterium]|nr:hypothetical protein [Bacillales bacterium]
MKKVMIIGLFFSAACFFINHSFVNSYVTALKDGTVPTVRQENHLYQEILRNAPKYEVKAANARIDKIWKAIPGYNGIKVDVRASYANMKQEGNFDEKKLVFKQI